MRYESHGDSLGIAHLVNAIWAGELFTLESAVTKNHIDDNVKV